MQLFDDLLAPMPAIPPDLLADEFKVLAVLPPLPARVPPPVAREEAVLDCARPLRGVVMPARLTWRQKAVRRALGLPLPPLRVETFYVYSKHLRLVSAVRFASPLAEACFAPLRARLAFAPDAEALTRALRAAGEDGTVARCAADYWDAARSTASRKPQHLHPWTHRYRVYRSLPSNAFNLVDRWLVDVLRPAMPLRHRSRVAVRGYVRLPPHRRSWEAARLADAVAAAFAE